MDHFDHNLFIRQLGQALLYCLYRTLNIGFYDDWEFFYITGLDLGKQIIQG